MRRIEIPFSEPLLKRKLLHWAAAQPYCVVLDSCETEIDRCGKYDFLIGVALRENALICSDLGALQGSIEQAPEAWRFGFFSYDLKADIEPRLHSDLEAVVPFPKMGFFQADIVVAKPRGRNILVFETGYSEALWSEIVAQEPESLVVDRFSGFESNFTEAEYCATIAQLRGHIRAGDCYEINLSQNFKAQLRVASPISLWEALTAASPVPFAAYCRWKALHLLCASPERFLQLQDGRLLTQPIKGTAPRSADPEQDAAFADALRNSEKEQAENVMIVDLSRNDLHRSCEVGSVTVPHLFEVQHFPQVHHLVSTIQGQKRPEVHPIEAIRNAFPPGSMTGAPKVRTCELIAQYEQRARGIYAGSVGYIAPGGDFDFNVVIRSLVYDAATDALSYHVGGAITWDSDPAAEYAETLLKAQAISRLFGGM